MRAGGSKVHGVGSDDSVLLGMEGCGRREGVSWQEGWIEGEA